MFKTISNFFKSINEDKINDENQKMLQILDSESLTCTSCNNIAYPVWSSKNKYRCTECDRRFSNINHNLIERALNEFDINNMNYSKEKEKKLKLICERSIKSELI